MGASSKKVVVLVGGCDVDSEYSKSGLMFSTFPSRFFSIAFSILSGDQRRRGAAQAAVKSKTANL